MIRKTLIALLGLSSLASALIVCTPNFCELVRCAQVTPEICKQQNQEFISKSTMCECCDECIDYIGPCEPCGNITTMRILVKGGPPQPEKHCIPGYTCVEGRCEKVKTTTSKHCNFGQNYSDYPVELNSLL